jgi:hypothetical protein
VIVHYTDGATAPAPVFTVIKVSARGDTVFSRRIEYVPEPLSDRHFQAALEEAVQLPAGAPAGLVLNLEDVKKNAYRPSFLPPIRFVTVAGDETIWLHRHSASAPASYLVLTAGGTPVATVAVPDAERVLESNGSRVWTAPTGRGADQVLTWYRIVRQ